MTGPVFYFKFIGNLYVDEVYLKGEKEILFFFLNNKKHIKCFVGWVVLTSFIAEYYMNVYISDVSLLSTKK